MRTVIRRRLARAVHARLVAEVARDLGPVDFEAATFTREVTR